MDGAQRHGQLLLQPEHWAERVYAGSTSPLEGRDRAAHKRRGIRRDARIELESNNEQVPERRNDGAALDCMRDATQPVLWEAVGAPQEGGAQPA